MSDGVRPSAYEHHALIPGPTLVQPMAMSVDWRSIVVSTAQVWASEAEVRVG